MATIYDDFIYKLTTVAPATYYTIDLPKDLEWVDESTWSPIEQSSEYSLTGAFLIQEGVKQKGRAITLVGKDDMAWVDRTFFDKILLMRNLVGAEMTLQFLEKTWNGSAWVYANPRFSYNVSFDHTQGSAVELECIKRWDNFEPDQWFRVRTIKLMEV
jgi:hypothetical protein